MGKIKHKLCITGCGRSGTSYITALLNKLGVEVEHEVMGKDGIVSGTMANKPTEVPWGPVWPKGGFRVVLHQVRRPLDVISSNTTAGKTGLLWLETQIPISINMPKLERAAKYWYYWNLEAEKIATWRYQIEDLPNVFEKFCKFTGAKYDTKAFITVPTNINTRKHEIYTWDQIREVINDDELYKKMREMESRYGYTA